MAIDFVLDESGNIRKDEASGLCLIRRNGREEPLDLDRLFQGINDSNRDAQAKRQALEKAEGDLEAARGKIEALTAEMTKLSASGGGRETGETETERRIKALEKSLAEEREEKQRIQAEQERREKDRQIEAAFNESAYASEHGHIPLDFWLARYRGNCVFEDIGGARRMVVKDDDGNVIMSEKTPGVPAKLDEGLAALCASRPKTGDIKLNPAPLGGSGALPTQRYGAAQNPWKAGQENKTQQHRIMAEDPALARRLAAEAGAGLLPL